MNKPELLDQVATARLAGQTIVHCHGCFDIVHPGHVRYLEFARQQGDLLVVSLTGDSQINKGDQRPYIPQELRAENLAALEVVDLVYVDPEPTAVALLEDLRPDLYVKGREYEQNAHPDFAAERAVVERHGGRVLFSSGEVVFSSTRLIETIGETGSALADERLTLLCRRHGIDRPACERLLAGFEGLNVLVVGDVILDRYVLCDAKDLASEAPMMSLARLEDRVFVGGAGIVARHVAQLGANAFLLSRGGDNDDARRAAELLEHEGVEPHLIPGRPRLPEKTRFLVEHNKLLRVEDGQSQPLDTVCERQAIDYAGSRADRIDAIIYCDFGYGMITASLLERLRAVLRGRSPISTADVSGPRGKLLDFKDVDLLCPTERELRSALHDFDRGLSNVVWTALEHTQARHMLVTLGKKGVVTFDRQSQDPECSAWRSRLRSEYLPAMADRVIDPLGCGDAMLATATLTLAAGGSLMQAAYLGSAAAALEIAHLGNVPINRTTLRARLMQSPELRPLGTEDRTPSTAGDGLAVSFHDRRIGTQRCRVPLIERSDESPDAVPARADRISAPSPLAITPSPSSPTS